MFYCKCNKFGWDNTHTYGFNVECHHDPSAFCLPVYHYHWKFSGTAPNHGTTDDSSVGGGTQGRNIGSKHTSSISELIQRHQVESSKSNFTSFLSNLSELMDSLKLLGMAYLTVVDMTIHSFHHYLHSYCYMFTLCYLLQVCMCSYPRYGSV